jgi:hypothetical protein
VNIFFYSCSHRELTRRWSFPGKWLRAMGVDCILIDIPSIDSIQMVLAEGRLFLSADRKLVDKREFHKSSVSCSEIACVNF